MNDFLVTHTRVPAAVQAPSAQLPAIIADPKSRIDAGLVAVQRAQSSFLALTSDEAAFARAPVRGFGGRHPVITNVLGWGGILGAVATAGACFCVGWGALWALPAAVASFGACCALETARDAVKERNSKKTLELKDVEPILASLRETSGEERALIRLFVEQHSTELEAAKRLTPKAGYALREAIQESAETAGELSRTGALVAFASKAKTQGEPTDDSLRELETILRDSSATERTAAADYLESTLFPNERALEHMDGSQARMLFAIIANARRGLISATP